MNVQATRWMTLAALVAVAGCGADDGQPVQLEAIGDAGSPIPDSGGGADATDQGGALDSDTGAEDAGQVDAAATRSCLPLEVSWNLSAWAQLCNVPCGLRREHPAGDVTQAEVTATASGLVDRITYKSAGGEPTVTIVYAYEGERLDTVALTIEASGDTSTTDYQWEDGRIVAELHSGGRRIAYNYEAGGRVVRDTFDDAGELRDTEVLTFNEAGQVSTVEIDTGADGTVERRYTYAFEDGRQVTLTEENADLGRTFVDAMVYDDQGRLVRIDEGRGPSLHLLRQCD